MRSPTCAPLAWLATFCLTCSACSQDTVAPAEAPPAASEPAVAAPMSRVNAPQVTTSPALMPPSSAPAAVSGSAGAPAARSDDDAAYLGLVAPQRGFRLATRGREIAPQSDVEYCEIAEVPGAPGEQYKVGMLDLANASGSHHLIVTMAAPGSPAERQLRAHPVGEQIPCISAQAEFGQQGTSVLASSQTRLAKTELPKGVGQRIYGGQRLVFDYHYFNLTDKPLSAKSAIAVHTLPPEEPVTFISALAFSNMTIDTPPHSERTFTAVCTLKNAVMLSGVSRHTHQHGTDFSVWFEGGARHGQLFWSSSDWEHDTDFKFREPLQMQPGEGFKFACGFKNDGDAPLRFGIRASDEMCILGAAIWSPVPQGELADEQCVVTWVDDKGVGRDTDESGGFPAADPLDALTCHAGTLGLSIIEGCLGCMCDACATIMTRCQADADCKALLECSTSCMPLGSVECSQKCEPAMFEHSSAVGMITQVGECIRASCGEKCQIATPGP